MLGRLEQHMTAPTARGLADAVSTLVRDGRLAEGDRLPPIRRVATELGLSPTTVSSAWAMLQRAGVVSAHGRNGTRVAPRRFGPRRYRSALTREETAVQAPDEGPAGEFVAHAAGDGIRPVFVQDLSTGTPDRTLLPSVASVLGRISPPDEPASYLDDPVLPELAELLHADWPCDAETITVVDGAMDALQLITATHLRFGDAVAVEDPCFPPLLDLLEAAGARALPMRLDAEGVRVADLKRALDQGARAVVVQPRGQNPTGITMTTARCAELAETLGGADVLVIEDDSLGAIAVSPDVSLGRALPDRTLHVRSYSKSHGPDLRIAALGGPHRLVAPIIERRFLGQGWTSRLLQRLLVALLTEPAAVATVAAARLEYARRRAAAVQRLAAAGIPVPGTDGLNIWVPVADETAALLLLATHGIGASSGRPFTVDAPGPVSPARPHVRITVGSAQGDIGALAEVIAAAARAHRRPAAR